MYFPRRRTHQINVPNSNPASCIFKTNPKGLETGQDRQARTGADIKALIVIALWERTDSGPKRSKSASEKAGKH
jgi:hypothetical protein